MNKLLNKKALKIKLDNRSKYLRQMIVQALIGGGRGHMGSAMSLVEILRVLYDDFIKINPKKPKNENRDRLILSKGHGCLGYYAALAEKKFIQFVVCFHFNLSTQKLTVINHSKSILATYSNQSFKKTKIEKS